MGNAAYLFDTGANTSPVGSTTLELKQVFCVGPAFVFFTNSILNRNPDIIEENLVDLMKWWLFPVDQNDRFLVFPESSYQLARKKCLP